MWRIKNKIKNKIRIIVAWNRSLKRFNKITIFPHCQMSTKLGEEAFWKTLLAFPVCYKEH